MPNEPTTDDLSSKRVFTTGEAATLCKVSQQTIIRCFDSGRLTGFRVPGSKFRRIPRDELIRFMRSNSIPLDALMPTRRRVLVVDDDPAIIEMYADLLGRDERMELKTASNGYDAGLLTEAFRPHLILLDYMLPDINGNIVCTRVRENPVLSDTRVLIVSGAVNQGEVQSLLDAGASGFVKKPFDIHDLLARVYHLLNIDPAAAGSSTHNSAHNANQDSPVGGV